MASHNNVDWSKDESGEGHHLAVSPILDSLPDLWCSRSERRLSTKKLVMELKRRR